MINKLLYLGIDESLNSYLKDKIYLANAVALLFQGIGIAYFVISWFLAPKLIFIPLIGANLAGMMVLLLNAQKLHYLSRLVMSITPSFLGTVYIGAVVQTGELPVTAAFFTIISFTFISFILTDVREPQLLYPLMAYTAFIILIQKPASQWIDVEMSSTVFRQMGMWTVFNLTGLLVMFYCLLFFLQKNRVTEEENQSLIDELEGQKVKIMSQNDILSQQQEEMESQRQFIEMHNKKLSDKNRLIQSSIHSAQAIQQAVLPSASFFKQYFEDYFVIFKPKDIVSGDFYWAAEDTYQHWLVVADCTGHGVPGAFMTLIGNSLLDGIIKIEKIHNPAEILNSLHAQIKQALRQDETANNNGMDAVVIAFDKVLDQDNLVIVTVAGAKNGLLYREAQQRTIQEIKGTRKSLGGFQYEGIQFENNEIRLPKGSLLYLGSDGLEDQNDQYRKKLGRTRLKENLQNMTFLPLKTQQEMLEQVLIEQMHNTQQRDDILWLGVML